MERRLVCEMSPIFGLLNDAMSGRIQEEGQRDQSLRPSDFAPAFRQSGGPLRGGLFTARLEAVPLSLKRISLCAIWPRMRMRAGRMAHPGALTAKSDYGWAAIERC